MSDTDYMRLALEMARKGCGWVSPNPMVGAVIVKNNRVIARGYHHRCGDLHAERDALRQCTEPAHGATMYVTLEPCCHQGRQPPCTSAILQAGIRKVVVGSGDPNPLVAGKGLELLRSHGVEVVEHVLEDECQRLNQVFFHYIQTKRPFVVMKYAMTLDGKIAAYTGASRWITGEEARKHVHQQRHRYSAIMVGVGTVLADDPLLTCRLEGGKHPTRVVCDTRLQTPLEAQIVQTAREVPTILATCCGEETKRQPYLDRGCQILTLPKTNGHVDLSCLMAELGRLEIDSILLEGGGTLNWSALEAGIVNKVQAYIAPKLFGGAGAKSPVEGQGFPSPEEGILLENSTITRLGADFLIESEVKYRVHRDC